MNTNFSADVKRYESEQDKYTIGPMQLDLSQQFCQSINTFWVNNFFGHKKYLGKTSFHEKKYFGRKFLMNKNYMKNNRLFMSKNNFWTKNIKTHNLCLIILNYTCKSVVLYIQQYILIEKAHVKYQPIWMRDFFEKKRKIETNTLIMHILCLIINAKHTIFID